MSGEENKSLPKKQIDWKIEKKLIECENKVDEKKRKGEIKE